MKVVDIPSELLMEAPWNPNQMNEGELQRLAQSIDHYGVVTNLVVRQMDPHGFEVLSGNQRLKVLKQLGLDPVPCVVVDLDDAHAMLLTQALNRIEGTDDLGRKAQLLQEVLKEIPQTEVLALLPETSQSLQAFADLGQQDVAGYLQAWQQAKSARLKHLTFQSTPAQLEIIEEALARVMPGSGNADSGNPNPRGNALFMLCRHYLELIGSQQ